MGPNTKPSEWFVEVVSLDPNAELKVNGKALSVGESVWVYNTDIQECRETVVRLIKESFK